VASLGASIDIPGSESLGGGRGALGVGAGVGKLASTKGGVGVCPRSERPIATAAIAVTASATAMVAPRFDGGGELDDSNIGRPYRSSGALSRSGPTWLPWRGPPQGARRREGLDGFNNHG
jgi:hypothetical protein